MRIARLPVVVVVLALAAAGVVGATGERADAAHSPKVRCARLAERMREVPGIQMRIVRQVRVLEQQVAGAEGSPRAERVAARLQPRIDELERLATRLAEQLRLAEQRCGTEPV